MFDHVGVGVTDLEASKAFYRRALSPMGVRLIVERPGAAALGLGRMPSFWLGLTDGMPLPVHLAFAADNRGQVDEFYRQALAAGGLDNGPPGLRPHYHANYYAAFVIGPDGHNIEAVCHRPEG